MDFIEKFINYFENKEIFKVVFLLTELISGLGYNEGEGSFSDKILLKIKNAEEIKQNLIKFAVMTYAKYLDHVS